ncbi:TraX family protein [[Mycoplasma] collis]|uniref:TraX family protein n=1 Tax=[Mycoplasma] collis TaxID=2127 RepID=UPI00068D1DB9|nr:TraX family protein [[Mycoplasma] collis]
MEKFKNWIKNLYSFSFETLSWNFLTSNILRFIAVITMFVDHFGFILFPTQTELRIIGRIAFPIYAFLSGVAINKTNTPLKYLAELFLFGAIIQIVYIISSLFIDITFDVFTLNIFFQLFLGTLTSYVFIKNKKLGILLFSILTFFYLFIEFKNISLSLNNKTSKFGIDYKFYGYLIIVFSGIIFNLTFKYFKFNNFLFFKIFYILFFIVLNLIYFFITKISVNDVQIYSLLVIPFLLFYSHKKPHKNKLIKIFFWSSYPLSFIIPSIFLIF